MDSNEQQQQGAGAGGFGGFSPFGDAFWSQFTGGKGSAQQSENVEDLFKEFEQFFSMGGEGQKTRTRGSSAEGGRARGKDVNVMVIQLMVV